MNRSSRCHAALFRRHCSTRWITFHCRGITSSVSVISSPSFDSFVTDVGRLADCEVLMPPWKTHLCAEFRIMQC